MNKLLREEFEWHEVSEYLEHNVTTAFIGPGIDERSSFFSELWKEWNCQLVKIKATPTAEWIEISVIKGSSENVVGCYDLITGLRSFLLQEKENLKVTCIDLSSLQHSVLMYLAKLLLIEIKPQNLFATYAQPAQYNAINDLGEFRLSEELLGLRSVPGFARRVRGEAMLLMAFLGFEGTRLTKIIEDMQEKTASVIPVIGFPAFRPGWQSLALRNCRRAIEYADAISNIYKCKANSIFDAYELIHELRPREGEVYALAPLGTRPHSMACAIYATHYPGTRLLYDHPIETARRSIGITRKQCYHLTTFI